MITPLLRSTRDNIMLKIYGFDVSPRALKVKMCANVLGIDYDDFPVNLPAGEQKTEEYLAIHPAGKIPAIEDDGFILFESNAICKYLCRKSRSELYPEDLFRQALVDQWCDFVAIHIDVHYVSLLVNKVFAEQLGVEVDQRALMERPLFIDQYLTVIEGQFDDNRYLAGNEMSVADISLLATIDPSELLEIDIASYPKLNAWRDDLRSRDFYRKVHNFYGESMMAGD